jgi:RNA polymerase sigma factor (TIGR02999 family)
MQHVGADITDLLERANRGDSLAMDQLLPQVYDKLRALAHRHLRGEAGPNTLNTTALVHEAYICLVSQDAAVWQDRAQFYGYAATAMRHILVDHARRRGATKRGGPQVSRVDWQSQDLPVDFIAVEMVALDDALVRLNAVDERLAKVVELRFFAGLSVEECADVLSVASRSVIRDWRKARAFLHQLLEPAR